MSDVALGVGTRESASRLSLLPDPLPDRVIADSIKRPDGTPINLFRVLAHHPRLLTRISKLGGLLLQSGELPVRDRELAILRVAATTGCEFEFAQHAVRAKSCDVSNEEVAWMAAMAPLDDGWGSEDRDLIDMTDQLLGAADVDDDTLGRIITRFGPSGALELIVVVGFYRTIATIINSSAGIPLEATASAWPEVRNRLPRNSKTETGER